MKTFFIAFNVVKRNVRLPFLYLLFYIINMMLFYEMIGNGCQHHCFVSTRNKTYFVTPQFIDYHNVPADILESSSKMRVTVTAFSGGDEAMELLLAILAAICVGSHRLLFLISTYILLNIF